MNCTVTESAASTFSSVPLFLPQGLGKGTRKRSCRRLVLLVPCPYLSSDRGSTQTLNLDAQHVSSQVTTAKDQPFIAHRKWSGVFKTNLEMSSILKCITGPKLFRIHRLDSRQVWMPFLMCFRRRSVFDIPQKRSKRKYTYIIAHCCLLWCYVCTKLKIWKTFHSSHVTLPNRHVLRRVIYPRWNETEKCALAALTITARHLPPLVMSPTFFFFRKKQS